MTPEQVFVKARTGIMTDYPFFGAQVWRPEYVFDKTCKIAWTDGKKIGFNPDFIMEYQNQSQYVMFFILHENAHIMLEHQFRRGSRDHDLYNFAADYEANALLKDMGLPIPEWALYNPEYHGKCWEEIYDILEAKAKPKEPEPEPEEAEDQQEDEQEPEETESPEVPEEPEEPEPETQDGDGDGDDGEDESGDSADDGENEIDGSEGDSDGPESEDGTPGGEGGTKPGDGNGEGEGKEGDGGEPWFDPKSVTEQYGETDHEPVIGEVRDFDGTPSEEGLEREAMKRVLDQSYDMVKRMGIGTASMERFVKERVDPEVYWTDLIRPYVENTAKNDFSWERGNLRFLHRGMYLPSLASEEVGHIVIANDTSGSRDDDTMAQAEAEINSILEDFQCEATVIHCDEEISVEHFTSDDLPIKLHPIGGGGTDFRPPFEYVEREGIEPILMIYLTDGWGVFPEHAPDYPVLWIIDDSYVTAPWGETINVNKRRF